MKLHSYTIAILVFLVFFKVVNGQDQMPDCATTTTSFPTVDITKQFSANSTDDCEPLVINIKVWGINKPDGSHGFEERPNDVLQAIAELNADYMPHGILFKFLGYESFDSPVLDSNIGYGSDYYIMDEPAEFHHMRNWAENNGYFAPNAINVYCFAWTASSFSWGGIAAGTPSYACGVSSHWIVGGNLFAHEVSHCLGLNHTDSNWHLLEHVVRDPLHPDFNADERGDLILDTNARPNWHYDGVNQNYNHDTCEFFGLEVDNVGQLYLTDHFDLINVMSRARECRSNYVSAGQAAFIKTIVADGFFDAQLTDVASLYEPYAGDYYFAGPTNAQQRPLFQPGFEYRFVPCSGTYSQPSNYLDTHFSYSDIPLLTIPADATAYDQIVHPNHTAIWIDLPVCEDVQLTRKCYNNWNRASSGVVTTFKDGVFNTNVKVSVKDSMAINDTQLVPNLPKGLHQVKKVYSDGSSQESIIVKD